MDIRKIICINIFITLSTAQLLQADTISFWHFYHNDSIILKGNTTAWTSDSGMSYNHYSEPQTVNLYKYNLYKDSLGFLFFCDYVSEHYSFYFIRSSSGMLINCIKATLQFLRGKDSEGNPYIMDRPGKKYIPIYSLLNSIPSIGKPISFYVYYLNPMNNAEFPEDKERCLGIIKLHGF